MIRLSLRQYILGFPLKSSDACAAFLEMSYPHVHVPSGSGNWRWVKGIGWSLQDGHLALGVFWPLEKKARIACVPGLRGKLKHHLVVNLLLTLAAMHDYEVVKVQDYL